MARIKHGVEVGNIYESLQDGKYEIIEMIPSYPRENGKGYVGARAKIRFIDTGYITTVRLDHVKDGNVKDRLKPDVYGVGCLGYVDNFYYSDPIKKRIYQVWCGMLCRCYNIEDHNYRFYGGLGVTVCDRWLRFEYFYEDFQKLSGYKDWLNNPEKYHLDKDTLQHNIPASRKKYSLETCILISDSENTIEKNIRCHDNFSNKYYGVHIDTRNNSYNIHITINGKSKAVGRFNNEIAASVYRDWYCNTNSISYIPNYEYPFMYPMGIFEAMQYKQTSNREPFASMHNPYTEEEKELYKNEMCHIDTVPRYKEMCKIVK